MKCVFLFCVATKLTTSSIKYAKLDAESYSVNYKLRNCPNDRIAVEKKNKYNKYLKCVFQFDTEKWPCNFFTEISSELPGSKFLCFFVGAVHVVSLFQSYDRFFRKILVSIILCRFSVRIDIILFRFSFSPTLSTLRIVLRSFRVAQILCNTSCELLWIWF